MNKKESLTEKARWRREGRWGGIKHLSDASLMEGHGDFRAPGLLFLPGVLGTTRKPSPHTSLFVHLPILSYVLIYLAASFHYLSILCPLCHLHNLACQAFVPLCLSFFAYSAIFCAYLLFTFRFDGVEGKDEALSLHLLISASRKEAWERKR